jgi:DNA-binding response OmpR family regulator
MEACAPDPTVAVLCITANLSQRRLLLPRLRAEGWNVLEAITAAEGLRLAAAFHPDLIIVGLGLDDMKAEEGCRRIRSESLLGPVPILRIVSSAGDPTEQADVFEAGASAMLAHPIEIAAFRSVVHNLVSSYRAHLAREEDIVHGVLHAHPNPALVVTRRGNSIKVNDAARRFLTEHTGGAWRTAAARALSGEVVRDEPMQEQDPSGCAGDTVLLSAAPIMVAGSAWGVFVTWRHAPQLDVSIRVGEEQGSGGLLGADLVNRPF